MDRNKLHFDYFPGMFFQRSPRFTCGKFVNEPALNLGGLTTRALKQVAKRFPETRSLCFRYDWTLRASYTGIFIGPTLIVSSTRLIGDTFDIPHDLRAILLIGGLALTGASLLLNKDTGAQLRSLVDVYNTLADAEKKPHEV